MSGKKDRGRPQVTFENIVPKIMEQGHVKSMRTSQKPFMRERLMTAVDGNETCRDRSVSALTTQLGIQRKASSSSSSSS